MVHPLRAQKERFRWSFMEESSAQATYLLFEELCLSDSFVYKSCVKSIKKIFVCILKVYLLSPTSFISIFILATSKQFLKNNIFLGGLEWYDPLIMLQHLKKLEENSKSHLRSKLKNLATEDNQDISFSKSNYFTWKSLNKLQWRDSIKFDL